MSKKLIFSVVVVVLVVGAFLAFNKYVPLNNGEQNNMIGAQDSNPKTDPNKIEIVPIEHATMTLKWGDKVIYIDPVGGAIAFSNQPAPDIILLTHTHSDHLSVKTLEAVAKEKTVIIAPMAVADLLPSTVTGTLLVMKNGEKTNQKTAQKMNLNGFSVEAVPAYNWPESADSYHKKGEGNGYILETGDKRVYISGDTADTPEVRQLKDIDIAFISINLPYTMSVEKAAEAVLEFKPKVVYPYHYRTPDGFSDVAKFKEIINSQNPAIEVIQLEWYPKSY